MVFILFCVIFSILHTFLGIILLMIMYLQTICIIIVFEYFTTCTKKSIMNRTEEIPTTISPTNPNSRWVALDNNDKIISEGETPITVIEAAEKKTADYIIMYVPKEGTTYIF